MFTFCNITFDLLNHLTPAAHARRGNHLPPLQFVVVSGRIPTSLALYSEHVTVPPFCKKTYTSSGRNFLLHPLRRTVAQVHHLQHSERSSPIKKDIEPRQSAIFACPLCRLNTYSQWDWLKVQYATAQIYIFSGAKE